MSLVPRWFRQTKSPEKYFGIDKFFENFDEIFAGKNTGLSVYDDDKHVFIEAHVPGLSAKEVEVSIDDDGVLWIKGEKREEDKSKRYYRKSQSSFSYAVPLWDEIDGTVEPEAKVRDGVMCITFARKQAKEGTAKRIQVKSS